MKSVNEQIWLTSAVTDTDVPNTLTLRFSLKRTATSRKIAVIVSPQVSRELREALDSCFDFVFTLQEDRNVAGLKDVEFAKLFGLTLKNFKLCVMLAPNMLALENCDELFDWGEQNVQEYASSKDAEMSVFVFRPSLQAFNRFLKESNGKIERNLISPTEKYIEDKYNRNLLDESEMLLETGKDILMVHLPAKLSDELETLSLGLVGQMFLTFWLSIHWKNVHPLLETFRNPNLGMLKEQPTDPENGSIAIVGMSCRYPGANSLDEFWDILLAGKDVTGKPPPFRWLQEQCSRPVTPVHLATNAGFLKCPLDQFDAKFFGLSPKEMRCLDPQHRLLHELVWEGLEDAAINPQSLEGTNGGVFMGSWTNDFKEILTGSGNDDFFRKYMGNSIGAGAARISHLLGLTGPNVATESGCSAAMVAVHLACKSLERQETNLALACGVNLLLHPFDKETMPMVLSPDGRCKTFDAKADGFGRAEGAGVLVLKRASDAIRDGDKIWALIRGSGMSQEGLSKSMGTPTVHSESLAMTLALQDANINPSRVSYVEAHGTGTAVGDPLEIASIAKAYHSKERKEPLLIGSVKTNVGHTESCSGITGIMKVVLAMQHEIIPPHRNLETLNPAIDLEAVPAKISLQPVEWKKREGIPRLAGVNSFGITGTDTHVILQEPQNPPSSPSALFSSSIERPLHTMKISAKTDEALEALLDKYKTYLTKTGCDFRHVAYTANIGRADFSQRAILIANSKEVAIKNIEQDKIMRGNEQLGKICFLFTGQGSQYSGMAKQLYETSPVFQMHFEYCEKILKNNYNIDITQVLWSEGKSGDVSRTIYSQTSIFCVEYALLKLWECWGVKPDYALGHSLGEFAAAVCAGILSVEDALKLVAERSRQIDELPRGKMLVIKAAKQRVDAMMNEFVAGDSNKLLDFAAINSLEQSVVAGDSEVVLPFAKFCKEKSLKCMVLEATHAFHSKHMNPILDEYRNVTKSVKILPGNNCKFISGMRGSIVEAEKIDAEYWVDHTREKVLFLNASQKAVELGCRTFIEIGPQPVLSALTTLNNDVTQLTCLPSLKRNEEEWETLLNTLGKLYVTGATIDWQGFERFYRRSKVSLPHYPFMGKKCWPDLAAALRVSLHPLLGSAIPNASSTKLFQVGLNLSAIEFIKDHAIGENVIFPGAGYLEMCLVAGLAAVEGSSESLTTPTRPMMIEKLTIEAPLSLVDSKTCHLQTIVELNTANESQDDWNYMKIGIYRKVESESGKWLPHARATFCPVPSAEDMELQFDTNQFHEAVKTTPNDRELSQFYEKLASVGLKFGPAFRSLEKIWKYEGSPNTLLAKVKVPTNEGQNQYIIHPVVLDAMIQAMMMLQHASSIKKKLYVPIKIGKFVWLRGMGSSSDIYIHINNSSALMVDSSGAVLAQMSAVELIDTTVKALESVLEQQTTPLPDMWEEVWRPEVGPLQHRVELEAGAGLQSYSEEFESLMKSYNKPSFQQLEIFGQVEKLIYLQILKTFYERGWAPEVGQTLQTDVLAKELKIQKDQEHYFRFMLETLAAEGVLQFENYVETWRVLKMPISHEKVLASLASPLQTSDLVQKFPPSLLISKLGENLSGVLQGQQSALGILFPEEAREATSVKDFYNHYQKVFLLSESFSIANKRRLSLLRDSMKGQRFILRILEVGAGTGGYTATFLKCLEEEGIEFEYTFTDITLAVFPAAQKRFGKYAKQMKFKKLNIEEDPIEQGFTPEYYDFVYMAEVIHATRNIRESLRNIRMLMKPHARMDMHEGTRENRIITYLVGALEGFWRFQDFDLRPRHCIISPQKWATVFEETGFKVDHSFPIHNSYHSHILVHKTATTLSDNMLSTTNKAWIVFHEECSPISNVLINKINNSAERKVITVTKGNNFITNGTNYEVRSWEADDFRKLLESVSTMGLEGEGVLYCWALNAELTSQDEILQPYFHLAQSVLTHLGSKTRIIALTENGAISLEGKSSFSHFHSSTLWGFTKSLTNENPSLTCKCIEVDSVENGSGEVFHELWQCDNEIQVAYQGRSRHVPRFTPHKPNSSGLQLPKGMDKFQLVLPETKAIDDLQFGPLFFGHLKSDHIEIQVKASALNFRDVLSIIKPSEEFRNSNGVGFDFAGVVKRVGSNVTRWNVGDKVFGCNTNFTAFPNHLQLDQEVVLRVPETMSYFDAATIPAVYTTSVLCLLEVAKIRDEDVVLIHTASGGVGLSAIEICKHVGCTIVATAGSQRKQNYLRSIGIQHIFHSRNTQFGEEILELTKGRGVDVVLNSLTSAGFKEASLKACAPGARFVEMSKLNIWGEEEVRKMRPDVKYTTVDVSTIEIAEWKRLFRVLDDLLQKNVVKAIPHVRFDGLDIKAALNYMQKAKHIGKIVCAMPEQRANADGKLKVYTPMFSERSTYLITGGLGGIGLEVCKWMLRSGAKHIILAGRSLPSSSIETQINGMNSHGANVTTVQLDVANFEQCRNLFENLIPEEMGKPRLRGVMHAAGTLSDGVILNQDWTKLSSTFKTKIDGTMNLHELTKHLNLEHFVMFSSMAALIGPPGQCNHAAGNCFEDALTHYRHSLGLPATTINWGQWGEVGIATEVDLPGIKTISNLQGITALEYALKTQLVQLSVFNVDSFVVLGKLFPYLTTYLDKRIWKTSGVSVKSNCSLNSKQFWQEYDSSSGVEEKGNVIKAQVQTILRNTLRLEEKEVFGDDIDLQKMGVDSLMFVEIRNGLQTLLDKRLIVSASALRDANTVEQITSKIVGLIEGTLIIDGKPTMEQVNQLIREDSQLPLEIRAEPGQQTVAVDDIKTVFLTGATGTLGPYLLKELTNLPQITQVVCLIRPTKASAEERLSTPLLETGLIHSVDMTKIRCITGNVALPKLGLTKDDWEELSGSVDALFNCSALVLHTELYKKKSSNSDTRAVNIGGMKNLLKFACERKLKHFVHASSLLGVVTTDGEGKLTEDWPEVGDYDNLTTLSYPISKFVCDMLAKEAVERGIPCKVLRLPFIQGEEKTGRVEVETNHLLLRYIFMMKSGFMPNAPLPIIALPVDTCAGVFVRLAFDRRALPDVYNIGNENPDVDQAFVNIAKRFGREVKIVESAEYFQRVHEEDENNALKLFKELYNDGGEFMSLFSNNSIIRWKDGHSVYKNKKVTVFIPNFYEHQLPTMEYIYNDLMFLKQEGWLGKFGL